MRFYVWDIFVVRFMYFFLRLFCTFQSRYRVLGWVLVISFGVEFFQYFVQPRFEDRIWAYVIGESYHSLDLVMYAIGGGGFHSRC